MAPHAAGNSGDKYGEFHDFCLYWLFDVCWAGRTANLMLVPLDATHYARVIEGYLCVNEHGAAYALLPDADWPKSTDSHSIDNAMRRLLRNGAPAATSGSDRRTNSCQIKPSREAAGRILF
jgi:hypothetical protein